MHLLHVVGARPNFMKAAPVLRALSSHKNVRQTLLHTGQHYDVNMSDVFFQELRMPAPDINLGVGSGSQTQQTAAIMLGFEGALATANPDVVVVYGDVNSTVASAMVCAKSGVSVAHVEAGLRSFDRTMPEETNRLLTDQLSEYLFTPSPDGNRNLEREGIQKNKVHLVGNVMIDTLVHMLPNVPKREAMKLPEKYVLVTLHRPANVDDMDWLPKMLKMLSDFSHKMPVIFPVHPRTRKKIAELSGWKLPETVKLLDPAPYMEFLALQKNATVVVTDSGGVQEETTYLGVPCLTVRDNTERPITIEEGTNILVGREISRVESEMNKVVAGGKKTHKVPHLWDGHAAERIAAILTA